MGPGAFTWRLVRQTLSLPCCAPRLPCCALRLTPFAPTPPLQLSSFLDRYASAARGPTKWPKLLAFMQAAFPALLRGAVAVAEERVRWQGAFLAGPATWGGNAQCTASVMYARHLLKAKEMPHE
jgi:hypothetical protein